MEVLIGIDDTDNLESRGTGYRARCLGTELEQSGLARVTGITRHQLLVDDAIPYTSHNSSACLGVQMPETDALPRVIDFCRHFLCESAADGSDVGLGVTPRDKAQHIREFGFRAQREVLERAEAEQLADAGDIFLEGLTGTHQGKIGALAAIALHDSGDDGRYIWVPGIRELEEQTLSAGELLRQTGVEVLMTRDGAGIDDPGALIYLGPWPRPVRVSGRAALLLESFDGNDADWRVVHKDTIKAFRP